jgi:V/A-type H+/Na+-transporting ATPase subunit I
MITSMKKIAVLAFHQDREKVIEQLQELGTVHVVTEEIPGSERVVYLREKLSRINKAIQLLEPYSSDEEDLEGVPPITIPKSWPEEIIRLHKNLDRLEQQQDKLEKEQEKLLPWGDWNPERIAELNESGIQVQLFLGEENAFQAFDFGEAVAEAVYERNGQVYFVLFSQQDIPDLPFTSVQLPEKNLTAIEEQLVALSRDKTQKLNTLKKRATNISSFRNYSRHVQYQLLQEEARNSFHELAKGKLIRLSGWFPARQENTVKRTLQQQNLYLEVAAPGPNDKVPVKLENQSYVSWFEPITRLFQLPQYAEMDLTPFVAVFYPILFAYCLGDAGYGLVLFVASFTARFITSRRIANLGMVLGLVTILMGIAKSGTLFGISISEVENSPFFSALARLIVISDDQSVVLNSFNVALMIGVVQIFTGLGAAIAGKWKFEGFPAALPQVGKLLIILALLVIFLGGMQELEFAKPYLFPAQVTLWVGIILVLFTHDLKQAWFIRLGSGILPLFFIFTGFLGDVLSYVRLFALGVASAVLGLVVNDIGLRIIEAGWWGVFPAILFLLFGHGLNFALAALGAFVHPLRLTFVEFYNNAKFRGGGLPYNPLKKLKYPSS